MSKNCPYRPSDPALTVCKLCRYIKRKTVLHVQVKAEDRVLGCIEIE